ncbi:MAG TPA: hypothetical protein VHA37_04405 [Candidatus Saccharimonadales bacterium]|nr:hypothetical protein [Candidatus Saccharimonadales bacterium]
MKTMADGKEQMAKPAVRRGKTFTCSKCRHRWHRQRAGLACPRCGSLSTGLLVWEAELSRKQKRLVKKHGTPAQFARACYECVPGDISMDEARAAVEKYNREWGAAA